MEEKKKKKNLIRVYHSLILRESSFIDRAGQNELISP